MDEVVNSEFHVTDDTTIADELSLSRVHDKSAWLQGV